MLRLIFRRHPSQETLPEYLDGRLNARASGKLEAHLSSCSACERQLEELRTTVGLLRQVPARTAALATSAAAVAFFAVLSTDLGGGPSSTPPPRDQAASTVAPAAAAVDKAVEDTQSSAEAQPAPEPGEDDSSTGAPSLEMAAPAAAPLAEDAEFETAAQQPNGEVERVLAESSGGAEIPEAEDLPPQPDEAKAPVAAAEPEAADAVDEDLATELPAEGETPGYWRAIEAVLGGPALLLGAGLLLIWRRSRTPSP